MANEGWALVAKAVTERRSELGLTQEQAAERAGISDQTWSLIERAERDSYRAKTLTGVTAALGWRADAIDQILTGSFVRGTLNAPVTDVDLAAVLQPTRGVETLGDPAVMAEVLAADQEVPTSPEVQALGRRLRRGGILDARSILSLDLDFDAEGDLGGFRSWALVTAQTVLPAQVGGLDVNEDWLTTVLQYVHFALARARRLEGQLPPLDQTVADQLDRLRVSIECVLPGAWLADLLEWEVELERRKAPDVRTFNSDAALERLAALLEPAGRKELERWTPDVVADHAYAADQGTAHAPPPPGSARPRPGAAPAEQDDA